MSSFVRRDSLALDDEFRTTALVGQKIAEICGHLKGLLQSRRVTSY